VYQIDIEGIETPQNKTSQLLQTMLDVMESIEQIDDPDFEYLLELM